MSAEPEQTEDTGADLQDAIATLLPEPVSYRDSLELDGDTEGPSTEELFGALEAAQGDVLDLDLTIQRPYEAGLLDYRSDPDEIRLNMRATAPETGVFSVVVSNELIDLTTDAQWFRVSGLFSVEPREDEHGVSTVFVLTELERKTPPAATDEQLCASAETELRVFDDARALARGHASYEDLREVWIDSPRLWGAVKNTAQNQRESGGTVSGDGVTVACEEFWGW